MGFFKMKVTQKAKGVKAKVQTKEKPGRTLSKTQEVIHVIQRTISSVPYGAAPAVGVQLHPAALTSIDAQGYPSTRTVVPTFVAHDLSEIRLMTKKGTRKEMEILANPKTSLHFQDPR